MAQDKYVSNLRGSDSTGTGSATTAPWKTIGKPIGSSPAMTLSGSGVDRVFIEPGIYRETFSLGLSPSSGNTLEIIGDCDGAGFAAGGYSTPLTGPVEIRAWTDEVTPMTSAEIMAASGKSYVTVKKIKFIGGNGLGNSCFTLSGTYSNWTFEDCIFVGSSTRAVIAQITATAGSALNVSFKRCVFDSILSANTIVGLQFRTPLNSTEYNLNVLIQNCVFYGSAGSVQLVQVGGSGSAWSTGITVQQCDFIKVFRGVQVGSSPALTTPIGVYGCRFIGCSNPLIATTSGQVAEDYNEFMGCVTPLRSNVTAGSHSKDTACPAYNLHDERLYGGPLRPHWEPSAVCASLGAGNGGTPPTVDLWNRPRPSGGGTTLPSTGSQERHDVGLKDVTHQDTGSPACLALVGPSDQERPILVAAEARTISIRVCWDGNHGDANKPQVVMLANPEIGVAQQTKTATSTGGSGSTPNSYETLTFDPITPTAAGVVIFRMVSRAAAGNGVAYFDTIAFS